MSNQTTRALLLAACVAIPAVNAQDNAASTGSPPQPPAVTLRVGDPAPPLRFGAWLKGEPFDSFTPGTVYVMEFWATWCGPCRSAMPHLSALAKKYTGRAVFTAVNVWENTKPSQNIIYLPMVEAFVKSARDMMAFNVAVDTESVVTKGHFGGEWLIAAGQRGIPSTFVIGKDGRIAWIGHPLLGLDEAIELALNDKLDAGAAAELKARYKAMSDESMELRRQLSALQKTGDAEQVVAFAEEMMVRVPFVADSAIPAKYAALAKLDQARARAYAEEIIRSHATAPFILRSLAAQALQEGGAQQDYELGVKLMEAAMQCTTAADLATAPTMADAYFKTGDFAQAVAVQQAVVEALQEQQGDPRYAQILKTQETALQKYQAARAGQNTVEKL